MVDLGNNLRQPTDARSEIISQEEQQRNQDERAQEVQKQEPAQLDSHHPGGKKGGHPETGYKSGDKDRFFSVIPEELPALIQTALGDDLAQMGVMEKVLAPFFPDGVNGQVPSQDSKETDGHGGVKPDDAQVYEDAPGQQSQLFRDGKAQPAKK